MKKFLLLMIILFPIPAPSMYALCALPQTGVKSFSHIKPARPSLLKSISKKRARSKKRTIIACSAIAVVATASICALAALLYAQADSEASLTRTGALTNTVGDHAATHTPPPITPPRLDREPLSTPGLSPISPAGGEPCVVTTPYQSKAATQLAKTFRTQAAQAMKDSSLISTVTPNVELNSCANLLLANASWLGTRLSAAQKANLIKLAEHNINPAKLKTLLEQIHQGFFSQAIHQTGAVDSLIEKYTNETLAADLTAQINTPDTPP